MDYIEWFPKRIADLRIQKGVSARDMSLSLGQSESYINKIENKRTLPSITGFIYICEYFGITPQEFFDVECEQPEKMRKLIENLKQLNEQQFKNISEIVEALIKK